MLIHPNDDTRQQGNEVYARNVALSAQKSFVLSVNLKTQTRIFPRR